MAVNTNIYGASDQWQNTAFYDKFYHNKKANFGNNTSKLSDGVTKGKLSYDEPIDKSLSYCGLGTECALSHVRYVQNVSNTATIIDSQDRFQTNFLFGEITTQSGMTGDYTNSQLSDFKYQKAWQANFDSDTWWSNNKNKLVEPYTSIHPKSVVFLIYVIAANSTFTNSINVTLSEYRTQYTTYPNISQVYIAPFMNDSSATENSPARTQYGAAGNITSNNRQGYCLGLLDEYEIPSRSFSMYSYQLTWSRIVMGNLYQTDTTERSTATAIVYVPENVGEHFKYQRVNIYDYYYIRTYIEYYDGIFDEILKTVACFGLYFTEKTNIAQHGLFTDNDMYIGILDSNGIGHGEYLRGADTATAPQNNYTDMQQSGYDYTKEVDKTKYINNTQFYGTWSSNAFTKMYVLTAAQVSALANELYTAVSAAPSGEEIERYNQSVFLTQNPIDCIISLKKFPMNLPYSAAVPMKLGSYTTTVNAAPLLYSTGIYSFTFSNSSDNGLYPWFDKSFLDYEPYTKCELTIPFCGTVEIPTTYLHDYDTIDVKLIVDFITGACTAYIQARNITIDSVSGECAVTLPVNGLQSATLDSQIHSAATARNKSALTNGLGLIGGLAAVGIGIATGGIGTAVIGGIAALTSGANMITQDKNIEYELQHMQVPMKQVSGASGAINQSYDMRCKMRITRPKISGSYDAEVYANTVGFACLINTTVSSLSGLTVGDINLDGLDASDVEKQLIKNAFASGVIL